jgi:hypothetical protein
LEALLRKEKEAIDSKRFRLQINPSSRTVISILPIVEDLE